MAFLGRVGGPAVAAALPGGGRWRQWAAPAVAAPPCCAAREPAARLAPVWNASGALNAHRSGSSVARCPPGQVPAAAARPSAPTCAPEGLPTRSLFISACKRHQQQEAGRGQQAAAADERSKGLRLHFGHARARAKRKNAMHSVCDEQALLGPSVALVPSPQHRRRRRHMCLMQGAAQYGFVCAGNH